MLCAETELLQQGGGGAGMAELVVHADAAHQAVGGDELHQLFVPGRSGQVKDVLIDGCGAVIGALIIWGISYLIHIKKK